MWPARRGPTVGRAAELHGIGEAIEEARSGRGTAIAFVGEAGIGKSRLLDEVATRAEAAGMTVLSGRAVASGGAYRALASALAGLVRADGDLRGSTTERLAPYRSALARILPDFGPAPGARTSDGGDSSLVVGEGIVRLLRHYSADRGSVLLLDDLHLADPDTVAALDYLTDSLRDLPVLLVFAARAEPARELLSRIGRRGVVKVHRLDRLDPRDTAELVRACFGEEATDSDVALVTTRSDGLPLLVEDLAVGLRNRDREAGSAPLPDTYHALVDEQMASVEDVVPDLLQVAAVAGLDLGWELLGEVAGLAPAATATAVEAAVGVGLLAHGDEVVWRHALTAEAVRAAILPLRRRSIAATAARLLEARGAVADIRLVDLLIDAEEPARAGALLLELARADLDRGAVRTAARHLDRLEEIAADVPWATEKVRQLTLTGRVEEGIATGEWYADRASGQEHAELCLALGRASIVAGRWAAAVALVARAGRPDDPRALVLLADAAYGAGDPEGAAEWADRAAATAEEENNPAALAGALLVAGRARAHTDQVGAAAAFSRATQVASEAADVALRITGLLGLATIEALDRPDPPALAAGRDLAQDSGLLAQVAGLDVLAADLALVGPGPRKALEVARRALDLAESLGLPSLQSLAEMYVGFALAELGDEPGAEELLARATSRPEASPEVLAGSAMVRAVAATVAGDVTTAVDLCDEVAAALAGHRSAAPVHWWGLWLLLRAIADRDVAAARSVFAEARATRRRVNRGAAAYAEAIEAGRNGETGPAAAAISQGDALLEGHPWWHHFLRVQLWSVAAPEGWADAVPGLRADLAWLEERGADALARRCRDLLRVAGAPVRRTPGLRVPPALRGLGVTSREAEVLALVAEGRSNADIAARLFVSVRTVETHVSRLLVKTGTSARTELAGFAAHLA